mmetsp:Transcript_37764/g.43407  ORF Transcript_37764/g.43407 Transcript_37764/m.43407 type:complete len:88 (+) Transcript_37764:508-771(+)
MNLISNSLKFTQEGGITVRININKVFDEAAFQYQRHLEFWVKDSGIGISREDSKNLFKLFGTIRKHQEGLNKRGTGLGLSISKKLTE